MRVTRFDVQGYKNLRAMITLAPLETFNVIHGVNNVGKSNLLQAIDLFFFLLTDYRGNGGVLPLTHPAVSVAEIFERRGFAPRDIFSLDSPMPILLRAEIGLSEDDLRRAGIIEDDLVGTLKISHSLSLTPEGGLSHRITDARLPNGQSWTPSQDRAPVDPALREVLENLARHVSRNFMPFAPGRSERHGRAFALIGTHRRLSDDLTPMAGRVVQGSAFNGGQTSLEPHRADALLELLDVLPMSIVEYLYDAREDAEHPEIHAQWKAFRQLWIDLAPHAGLPDGEPVPTYNRRTQTASLLWESNGRRIPFRLLGTGLQHIAALTAQIVRTGAAITAIEEPEIHLNYRLQIEFARALRLLAEKGIGPQQIIVTTHSPAFETEAPFFGMTNSEHGPEIHAHPSASAARFLGQGMHHPTGQAPLSYVTSEGLVQLPEFAREILGVRDGGGVVFHGLREGHVEVVNDQTYFAELGLDAADESA